jgi:hypothetical protein
MTAKLGFSFLVSETCQQSHLLTHTTYSTRPWQQTSHHIFQNHPDTDLKKLKSQYGPKLSTLRELFADWSDEDLVFALQEADGDLELTIDRISEGMHYLLFSYIVQTRSCIFIHV